MFDFSKDYLIVGRGATAIYLVLKERLNKAEVLVPANICYAAIYPIIYSGNIPVFCDVCPESGNINYEIIKKSITTHTKAVLAPHMYGNTIKTIKEIAEFCKEKSILLIEDCASAMGAKVNGKEVGSFADYSIFSTGYSKTIDLGNGGILVSKYDLTQEKHLYDNLDYFSDRIAGNNAEFSKRYRAFRNEKTDIVSTDFYGYVHADHFKDFVYKLTDKDDKIIKKEIIDNLESVIEMRRENLALYDELIDYNDNVFDYFFNAEAVPWRKNIFIKEEVREHYIMELLKANVPVSDWYPVSSILFDDYKNYKNAKKMGRTIVNFPLMISKNEIYRICNVLNSIKEK